MYPVDWDGSGVGGGLERETKEHECWNICGGTKVLQWEFVRAGWEGKTEAQVTGWVGVVIKEFNWQ